MKNQSALRRWSTAAAVVALSIGAIYIAYSVEMRAVRERIAAGSTVIETPLGNQEFAIFGEGPPVLAVHGAGGGYDQGSLIPQAFGGDGFRFVVPSRFGYLRTPLPADASTIAQADAFAALLDHLGIDRVAIIAMSGGVPPSLQFALRYPERTSVLVLISSAPYTPLTAQAQKLPVPIWIYNALFSSDFPFWALKKIARSKLELLFDVKPDLSAALTPEEKAFVDKMVDAFEPVTQRKAGLANEGAAINPLTVYPLQNIKAPILVIHAKDDGINPFAFGEYTAQHIPGAVFMPIPSGGHLLLGHHEDIRARVSAFLRQHAESAAQ